SLSAFNSSTARTSIALASSSIPNSAVRTGLRLASAEETTIKHQSVNGLSMAFLHIEEETMWNLSHPGIFRRRLFLLRNQSGHLPTGLSLPVCAVRVSVLRWGLSMLGCQPKAR